MTAAPAQRLAHDLRQFIPVIWGNCDFIERDCSDAAAVSRRVAEIRKAATHMEEIMRDALSQAVPSGRVVTLNTIVEELSGLGVLRRCLDVQLDLDADMPPIPAGISEMRLHRALVNLCSNARHAMVASGGAAVYDSSGSTPDLVQEAQRCGTLTIGTRALEGAMIVFVTDTGRGMTVDEHDRLRARMNGGQEAIEDGHGYGLQFVRAIVDEVGGRVHIKTAPGEGTTFTLVLPIGEQPEELGSSPAAMCPAGSERAIFR